jgi:hypothetical protein
MIPVDAGKGGLLLIRIHSRFKNLRATKLYASNIATGG